MENRQDTVIVAVESKGGDDGNDHPANTPTKTVFLWKDSEYSLSDFLEYKVGRRILRKDVEEVLQMLKSSVKDYDIEKFKSIESCLTLTIALVIGLGMPLSILFVGVAASSNDGALFLASFGVIVVWILLHLLFRKFFEWGEDKRRKRVNKIRDILEEVNRRSKWASKKVRWEVGSAGGFLRLNYSLDYNAGRSSISLIRTNELDQGGTLTRPQNDLNLRNAGYFPRNGQSNRGPQRRRPPLQDSDIHEENEPVTLNQQAERSLHTPAPPPRRGQNSARNAPLQAQSQPQPHTNAGNGSSHPLVDLRHQHGGNKNQRNSGLGYNQVPAEIPRGRPLN